MDDGRLRERATENNDITALDTRWDEYLRCLRIEGKRYRPDAGGMRPYRTEQPRRIDGGNRQRRGVPVQLELDLARRHRDVSATSKPQRIRATRPGCSGSIRL